MTQAEKAPRLRRVHDSPPLMLPNAWDAASTRVIELAGAPTVATTSAAQSRFKKRADPPPRPAPTR